MFQKLHYNSCSNDRLCNFARSLPGTKILSNNSCHPKATCNAHVRKPISQEIHACTYVIGAVNREGFPEVSNMNRKLCIRLLVIGMRNAERITHITCAIHDGSVP